jgi:hypothetical protein
MNRQELQKKLNALTNRLLYEKGHVAFVDLFLELGYLDPQGYDDWRRRRLPYLERVIRVNLNKINFIMKTVRSICRERRCRESAAEYRSWGKGRKVTLRFSKSGEPAIERTYSTHFLSPQGDSKQGSPD